MKGIGHFLTGIAIASCFPEAMRATIEDNSLILLVGGAFGLLPDPLDFRISRYLWKHDRVLTPDLKKLDARVVAETVAAAIDEAHESGRAVRVKLNTLKVSASYHRTYSFRIDTERKVVRARIGPLKTMSQVMGGGGHLPRSLPLPQEGAVLEFEAPYKADVITVYDKETSVGIFSGPDFSFVPVEGKVRMDFIPWHRTWAHSPFLGLVFGILGWLVYSLFSFVRTEDTGSFVSPMALTTLGVITLSFWGHIFVDQFGVLGSVLGWPFSKKRSNGFGWTHASSVVGNIILNYVCLAIIFWNLIVHTKEAGVVMPWASSMQGDYSDLPFYVVSLLNYLVYVLVIPISAFVVVVRIGRKLMPPVEYPGIETEMEGYLVDEWKGEVVDEGSDLGTS